VQEANDNFSILPWHHTQWQRLQAGRTEGRLPHALLINGAAGLGKSRFAHCFAASLLCTGNGKAGMPCGNCRGCLLLKAGNHPDFTVVMPEEPGKGIRIDAIRGVTSREVLTAQYGGYKVIIIEPADALNISASNSLLKTLEEPVSRTLIILVTSIPGKLQATIRSRCQRVDIRVPERSQARVWLKEACGANDPDLLLDLGSGAPLLALELADPDLLQLRTAMLEEFVSVLEGKQNPVVTAARWDKQDLKRVLAWISGWVIDILRLKSTPETSTLLNPDQRKSLQAISNTLEFKGLYEVLDEVYKATGNLGGQLNTQMLLEGLLLRLRACCPD
jgi:DNA polymerase-3 subunit delta'